MKTAPNAANSTAYAYCYLATDTEWAAKQHLDEMEDVAVEFMDLKDVRRALRMACLNKLYMWRPFTRR